MNRAWQTRTVAILALSAITLYAMELGLDGVLVPIIGAAAVSGVAGYEIGVNSLARRIN